MTSSLGLSLPRLAVAAAAFAALVGIAVPAADAAPTIDDQGFVDSTARCTTPDTAAAFGNTATSRVAICLSPSGAFEYRGVRVRDGAKLILPATRSGSGAFIAENDGFTYTLTSSSLTVTAGSDVVRQESMVTYRGPASSTPTSSTTPTTATTTATTTKLPPPMPAEVGGGG